MFVNLLKLRSRLGWGCLVGLKGRGGGRGGLLTKGALLLTRADVVAVILESQLSTDSLLLWSLLLL